MYERFAEIYDDLMSDIPYENYMAWISHECGGVTHKTIVDLGCGTGTLSIGFAHLGAHVTGIDLSSEMIVQATKKAEEEMVNATFICDSMTHFETSHKMDIAMIPIDSLNYLQSEKEVKETFQSVFHSLNEGGHFFFDVHSIEKIEDYLNGPFIYENEEVAYMWSTDAGDEQHSVYHDITFFMKTDKELYERFEEHHYQRTFPVAVYMNWLKEIGFHSIEVADDIFGSEHQGLRNFLHARK